MDFFAGTFYVVLAKTNPPLPLWSKMYCMTYEEVSKECDRSSRRLSVSSQHVFNPSHSATTRKLSSECWDLNMKIVWKQGMFCFSKWPEKMLCVKWSWRRLEIVRVCEDMCAKSQQDCWQIGIGQGESSQSYPEKHTISLVPAYGTVPTVPLQQVSNTCNTLDEGSYRCHCAWDRTCDCTVQYESRVCVPVSWRFGPEAGFAMYVTVPLDRVQYARCHAAIILV